MEALPEMYECVYPAILSNFDPKLLKGMMHVRVSGFHLNSISPNVTSLESVLGFSINKTVSDSCRPSSLTWSSSSPPSPPSAGPCLRRLVQSPGVARPERGLVMRSLGTSRTTSVNSVLNTVSSDTPGDYKRAALAGEAEVTVPSLLIPPRSAAWGPGAVPGLHYSVKQNIEVLRWPPNFSLHSNRIKDFGFKTS